MSTHHNRLAVSSEYSAVNYLPATLKTNKSGWLIEYYVENPQTQSLQRKKIRLERLMCRYSSKSEAKRHINNIIIALNMKLSTGWNPYFEGEDSRMYTPIREVANKYMEETEKIQREATIRSYKSFIKIFLEWIEKQKPGIYSSMISHAMIVRFMDYVYYERKASNGDDISEYTYNHYIRYGSAFFSWMIEKCYCKENHFSKIKYKKTHEKRRTLIPEDYRNKIEEYLQVNNPRYLIMLKLIYAGLIRPKELRMLKLSDLSFAEKQIKVRKEVAKNGQERLVPISDEILESLLDLGINQVPNHYYIFGRNYKPGELKMSEARMTKTWTSLRKKLDLPKTMQMYSFRDTGITDMIKNGIDPLSVKQLANHHSLEITNIYTNHVDPNLRDIILSKAPKFSKGKEEKEE
jgi:site-specific recombinase XerD